MFTNNCRTAIIKPPKIAARTIDTDQKQNRAGDLPYRQEIAQPIGQLGRFELLSNMGMGHAQTKKIDAATNACRKIARPASLKATQPARALKSKKLPSEPILAFSSCAR
jgi:hypothetical protein